MSKNKQKSKAAPIQTATVTSIDKQNKVEYVIVNLLCLFVFLAFGYIAVMGFFQTSVINPEKYVSENILFQPDIIPLNILCTAVFIAILFAMRRFYDFFAKVNMRIMEIGLAVFVAVIGLIWIFSVRSVPAADSANIFEAATGAANGDYTSMQNGTSFYNSVYYEGYSYFNFYPFQLGFVAFCEFFYRIFGTDSSMPIQVLNVLSVAMAYFAIARITKLLFGRKLFEFITILLLAVCFQPILFCTFVYGNIIGMSLALWASLFLIKYFQTGQYRWIYPSGALLVLATLVKYNNMIYLAAFVIMLIIHIFKSKRWQSAVIAGAMIVAAVGSSSLVVMHYESRSDNVFAEGVSQVMYLDVGLQDSYMAPGWYTSIGKDTYMNNYLIPWMQGSDVSVSDANKTAWADIENRVDELTGDFEYGFNFFSQKILSQWNEPTFESVWVSKVKSHEADSEQSAAGADTISSEQLKGLGELVYYKSLGQALELHFGFYMQIIYIMFAAGIYLMFINKKTNIETVLLPLVLLGAFGYHLLFEGKSQYILTYIPLLIPTVAYAFGIMLTGKYTKTRAFFKKLNHIPDRFE